MIHKRVAIEHTIPHSYTKTMSNHTIPKTIP
jgi:hypothetical protein